MGRSNQPDYYNTDVPGSKSPEDYEWQERRAEILGLILERGSPHGVTQARLAERYDVSTSQISQDMDRLREHVDKHLGRSAKMTTRAAYQKALNNLQEQGEYREAFEVAMEWNEWLQDVGAQEKAPEKHEISGEVETQHTEKKMLVGVNLDAFPDVDTSRMVGVDLRESEAQPQAQQQAPTQNGNGDTSPENGAGTEISLEEPDDDGADPGGNTDSSGGGE